MHILEQYAVNCGAKISKPYISPVYYPIPFEKYICLHAGSGMESKNYDFYDEVVGLILPFLEKLNIKIIQIGGEQERKIKNCHYALGSSKRQMAYIISNSLLCFGNDTMSIHFASYFNKKIVCASSVLFDSCFYPYWSDKKDYTIINSHRDNKKPSFSAQEKPKTINLIKPEEIAIEILNHLNIKNDLNKIHTIHLGEGFYNSIVHHIPDHLAHPSQNIKNLNIRMDLFFNESALVEQLKLTPAVITTNKPINIDILKSLKQRIYCINYFIDDNHDPEFILNIKKLNIKYNLYSFMENQDLNKYKIHYMDLGLIQNIKFDIKEIQEKINNYKDHQLYYKSNHIYLSKGNIYLSEYDYFKGANTINNIDVNTAKLLSSNILKEDPKRFIIFAIDNI